MPFSKKDTKKFKIIKICFIYSNRKSRLYSTLIIYPISTKLKYYPFVHKNTKLYIWRGTFLPNSLLSSLRKIKNALAPKSPNHLVCEPDTKTSTFTQRNSDFRLSQEYSTTKTYKRPRGEPKMDHACDRNRHD